MPVAPGVLELVKAHRGVQTLSVYLDGSVTDFAERNHWRVELVHEIARVRATIHGAAAALLKVEADGVAARLRFSTAATTAPRTPALAAARSA